LDIFSTIQAAQNCLSTLKNDGKMIGFVPTMGALHMGHVSLLEKAKRENDISVSSIFVNPLQFNDKKDLERYPRSIENDIEKLKSANCDIFFAPSPEEMYGKDEQLKTKSERNTEQNSENFIDLGNLDKVMEGKYRPGHFNGVCVVVKKLFDIIEPNKAYFGEKDFQQLVIIKHMVKLLNIPVQIIPCPTLREESGLAMSSRNTLLTSEDRMNASHIFRILSEAKEKRKNTSVADLQKWVSENINENPSLQLDYFEIVNSETLLPVSSWEETKNMRACVAVKVGSVRLIDNIPI
jgi:pantoate--beta-alanine ligase